MYKKYIYIYTCIHVYIYVWRLHNGTSTSRGIVDLSDIISYYLWCNNSGAKAWVTRSTPASTTFGRQMRKRSSNAQRNGYSTFVAVRPVPKLRAHEARCASITCGCESSNNMSAPKLQSRETASNFMRLKSPSTMHVYVNVCMLQLYIYVYVHERDQ